MQSLRLWRRGTLNERYFLVARKSAASNVTSKSSNILPREMHVAQTIEKSPSDACKTEKRKKKKKRKIETEGTE